MEIMDFIKNTVDTTGKDPKANDHIEKEYIDNTPTIKIFRTIGIFSGNRANSEGGICFISGSDSYESRERVVAAGIIEILKNMIISYIGYEYIDFAESTAEGLGVEAIEEFLKKETYRNWVIENGGNPDELNTVVLSIVVKGRSFGMMEDVIDDNNMLVADSDSNMRVSAVFAHRIDDNVIFMS